MGFHETLAMGVVCQKRTLTLSGHVVLSRLRFAIVLHVETIYTLYICFVLTDLVFYYSQVHTGKKQSYRQVPFTERSGPVWWLSQSHARLLIMMS